jgi:hypothetical protein
VGRNELKRVLAEAGGEHSGGFLTIYRLFLKRFYIWFLIDSMPARASRRDHDQPDGRWVT